MRTNIEIDDSLLKQAMRASKTATKKAAVEAALRQMVRLKQQERILKWFGKVKWEGDLNAMRESRQLNADGYFDQEEPAEGRQRKGPEAIRRAPARRVATR
jgi:Arc/MetJ family transcription regulator